MQGIYTYHIMFSEVGTIGPVFKELRQRGFCVPDTDYFGLEEMEPYKTIQDNTPLLYGRRDNPFYQASPWADGLRIDLYSLQDKELDCGTVDEMIIDIGCAVMSRTGIEKLAKELAPENVLAHDTIRFHRDTKQYSKMSTLEKKRMKEVVFLAYTQ